MNSGIQLCLHKFGLDNIYLLTNMKKKIKNEKNYTKFYEFKYQVGLMKVVTYQFISKSPAEVN